MLAGAYGDPPEPEKESRGWLRKHFSVSCWCPYVRRTCGEVRFVGVSVDWCQSETHGTWVALDVTLLGFGVSFMYWPEGKG